MAELTQLIEQVAAGDNSAREQLFAQAYGELRKLARARLRDGGRNTYLQTTSLVHEAYLRIADTGGPLRAQNRRAFFSYASRVMRSVIVDAVRERRAVCHGGDVELLALDTVGLAQLPSAEPEAEVEVMQIHEALLALEQAEPRLAQVVEMRYFGGYTEAEIAHTLELNERTVRRDWEKARLILMQALKA